MLTIECKASRTRAEAGSRSTSTGISRTFLLREQLNPDVLFDLVLIAFQATRRYRRGKNQNRLVGRRVLQEIAMAAPDLRLCI